MFKTKKEIEEYLDHDKLECLECGKDFFQLGRHIVLSHEMTVDDYKDKYGLPYSTGLFGKENRNRLSELRKEDWKSGKFNKKQSLEAAQKANHHVQRSQPYHNDVYIGRRIKMSSCDHICTLEDLKKLKEIKIKSGLPITEICNDKNNNLPSRSSIKRLVEKNKEAKKIYKSILRQPKIKKYVSPERSAKFSKKLSDKDILVIFKSKLRRSEVAKIYNISKGYVDSIRNGNAKRNVLKQL